MIHQGHGSRCDGCAAGQAGTRHSHIRACIGAYVHTCIPHTKTVCIQHACIKHIQQANYDDKQVHQITTCHVYMHACMHACMPACVPGERSGGPRAWPSSSPRRRWVWPCQCPAQGRVRCGKISMLLLNTALCKHIYIYICIYVYIYIHIHTYIHTHMI